jgi:YD repeat-containing protein
VTYFGYDSVNNRIEVRDGLQHTTLTRYDAVNRVTAIEDPIGNSVYFGYDAVGNRLKGRDQRQNTTYQK